MVKHILPSIVSQSFYRTSKYKFWKLFASSLVLSFILLGITSLAVVNQSQASPVGTLEILVPSDHFTIEGTFNVTFKITNTGAQEIVFTEQDHNNRVELEPMCDLWGIGPWSTADEGLTLAPGESFTKTIECEVGVYEGDMTIALVHRENGNIGALGQSTISGAIIRSPRTGSPVIGFYLINALYADLADYLESFGYLVKYVDQSDFMSVDTLYLDYRVSPPEAELLTYVNNGGNLWIDGESGESETNFLGAVIRSSGVEFWGSIDDPSRLWLRDHQLTIGVSLITYPAGAWITTGGNIEDVIRIDGRSILAIDESHKGRILWLIDSDIFAKYYLYDSDNEILAKNVADWLSGIAPPEDNPPAIEIISPSDGDTVSGMVTFQTYATDDHGLEKVEFYIDDELKVTHGPFGPDTVGSTCTWNPDTTPGSVHYIPNGSHSFNAKVYDTAGQTNLDTISFIVHNIERTQVDVETKYWEDESYDLRITADGTPGDISSIAISGPHIGTATVHMGGGDPHHLYDDGNHGDGEANDGIWWVLLDIVGIPAEGETIIFDIAYSDGSSETKQKSIDGVLSETAQLIYPPDGSPVNTLTPTFEWSNPSISGLTYSVQINDTNWNRVYEVYYLPDGTTSHEIPSGCLNWGETYYWLISASDINGNEALTNWDTFATEQPTTLLQKYAPILYLHPEDQYRTWGIEGMLEEAELWEDKVKDEKVPDMDPPISPTKLLSEYNDKKYYLNLQKYSPSGPIPNKEVWQDYETYFIYGRQYEDANYIVLQYWFFYPFNDWLSYWELANYTLVPFVIRHEGDWEMAQVVLDKAENPIKLCLAWHHDGNYYPWGNVQRLNKETHPKVFVAKGGHGCWASMGENGKHNLAWEGKWLYDETSDTGEVLYPEYIDPSSIESTQSQAPYELIDITGGNPWKYWDGKWGELNWRWGWDGPDSPANISYHWTWPKRWEDPIGWCNKLEPEGKPSYSQWGANAQSTPVMIIELHAYDHHDNHVGLTQTGEIEATIPDTYLYVPSSYGDGQNEFMWIHTSEDLRFEIEGGSGTGGSSKRLRSKTEQDAEGEFDFAFYRYLKEEGKEVTVTYVDVQFTEDTTATVDVSPDNPVFVMEIDVNGDGDIDQVEYPSYIENLVADIQAAIDIDPDTLNLQNKGKWITCYVELPEGHDVNSIGIATLLLMQQEDVVSPVAESSPNEVGDYDEDGIPDLMVKFDRAALIAYLQNQNLTSGQITLGIIGQVDSETFGGTDTITIKSGQAATSTAPPSSNLFQNYPNPFNPETTIEYNVAESCRVTIRIYNVAGQLIRTLIDEDQEAGFHKITWYGDNETGHEVASGVYFYQIRAGDFVSTKKMVVLK